MGWARRWHSEAPGSREVIVGYIAQDRMAEFLSAKTVASSET